MKFDQTQFDADARRFLFGSLAPDERSVFEAAFIEDEDRFDQLRAVEDEVIEQYVRGILPAAERSSFETHYLANPANQERVEVTRAMIATLAGRSTLVESAKLSFFETIAAFFSANRVAFGGAFVLLAAIAAAFVLLTRERPVEVVQNQPNINAPIATPATVPTPKTSHLNEKVPETNKPTPADDKKQPDEPTVRTPVLALFSGSLRGGGSMPTLDLPRGASSIRLQLNLDSVDYKTYIAEVVDPDGRVVARSTGLRPRGSRIDVNVSTSRIGTGEFRVKLSGINDRRQAESAADFSFRVTKK